MANNAVVKARETNMMQPMNHPMPVVGGAGVRDAMGGPPMGPRADRRIHPALRRGGFTLIELLVVIGIILILMGMLFVGMKYVGNSAKSKSTKTTLGNLQSMLATYDAQGRNMIAQLNQTFYNKWADPTGIPTAPGAAATPLILPANASVGDDLGSSRYAVFVECTNTVMAKILAVPENKAAMGKISTETLKPGGTITAPTNILLDAWNNPIIYVPSDGLDGVTYQGATGAQKVTSAGVVATGTAAPAGARPFWASAGPDGDFAKGDDNVYSFEQ